MVFGSLAAWLGVKMVGSSVMSKPERKFQNRSVPSELHEMKFMPVKCEDLDFRKSTRTRRPWVKCGVHSNTFYSHGIRSIALWNNRQSVLSWGRGRVWRRWRRHITPPTSHKLFQNCTRNGVHDDNGAVRWTGSNEVGWAGGNCDSKFFINSFSPPATHMSSREETPRDPPPNVKQGELTVAVEVGSCKKRNTFPLPLNTAK